MDEEIRQALTEVREMKRMCGNINMKLTNIVTQRGQNWKEKLEAEYQRGLSEGNDIGYKDGVKDGQNEVWEAVKKIVFNPNDGGLSIQELNEIFGNASIQYVCKNYSASEAIEKLKAYEEKQKADEDVKRGDVVRSKLNGLTYIVTLASEGGYVLLDIGGNFATSCIANSFEKTGKHVDIDKILEELRYDS